ncbi:PREDICTED: uncharacterized protein LOC109133276 [Camelina sativa]|uniref:Uncharacterized protein LOC109133276 n=1 Tax=Camelina sativa TaxID=90675 RepID=A0ABM1RS26_CAMSA|nr:PREDICTED: uncharacterized protein LOC109133276 [Camelina sativa]
MDVELENMEVSGTFGDVISLPPCKNVVGCKWVYTIKYNADGSVERYKARLVAKGYTQQEGVDFFETYSPVARMGSVKFILGLAAKRGWSLCQMDVTSAFLHSELDEEIYMSLPLGYTPAFGVLPPNPVFRLKKSIYGLKQASRQWYKCFSTILLNNVFSQAPSENTLFVKMTDSSFIALLVYVDDIMIASNSDMEVSAVKALLAKAFKIKDLGQARFFLGLEIARNANGISVSQRKYCLNLLNDTGYLGCKPKNVPMDPTKALFKDTGVLLPPEEIRSYRALIGRLLYLTITQPDITFAAAQHVLKYLKGNPGQGLFYSAHDDIRLTAFSDADWGTCQDTRRSVIGMCTFLGTSLITRKSTKHKIVSSSSTESEYRVMALASDELVWLVQLLRDL